MNKLIDILLIMLLLINLVLIVNIDRVNNLLIIILTIIHFIGCIYKVKNKRKRNRKICCKTCKYFQKPFFTKKYKCKYFSKMLGKKYYVLFSGPCDNWNDLITKPSFRGENRQIKFEE